MRRLVDRARGAWRRLVGSAHSDEIERRLAEEMQFHLEMHAERGVRAGAEAGEARRAAGVAFGGRERFAEEVRDEYRNRPLEDLASDARYALRGLRRAPAYTAAAVLTLALGIGATTVIFSMVDNVVLRPLAYPEPDRLVVVREVIAEMSNVYPTMSANASHFLEWRRRCRSCDGLAAFAPIGMTVTGDGDPQRVNGVRVSPNLFALLGARAALGRTFAEEENQPGRDGVVVLSDGFWRRRFGASPSVVGRTITLDDTPYVVLGVLPRSFRLPRGEEMRNVRTAADVDVYKPLALSQREATTFGEYNYTVVARLRRGVGLAAARAELDAIEADIATRVPFKITLRSSLTPLETAVVGTAERPLLMLLAAVALVLLIVCVNLASLALARSAGRLRESTVRVALGAGRGRLVRHALTESVVLALVGGVLGVLLAQWGLRALLAAAPSTLPRLEEIALDGRVLAVALLVSVAAGLSFGTLPALRLRQVDPAEALKAGSRSVTEGRRARRTRSTFIAIQAGLSTVLLVATGLFLASLVRVLRVDKGFAVERVLAVDIVLPRLRYEARETRARFYDQALERLAALPGVTAAAVASALPLSGESQVDMLSFENDQRPPMQRNSANVRWVSPGYFDAAGTRVLRGRAFTAADRGRNVVVLSERAARALWPTEDPLGKRVVPGSNDPVSEVIGVAADVRTSSLEREGSLVAYVPYWTNVPTAGSIILRTRGDAASVTAVARARLREVDPAVPIVRARTMSEIVSESVAARRFQLALLALFALTALATASVGIYGVVSHSLARRTGEMGVRMALGARPADVRRLVLGEGLKPVAIGLVVGIALSLVLGRVFGSLLFGVRPSDPLTLAAVVAVLGSVAAVACYVPARRATATDLARLLRFE
jgi:putative ABC transport system permease protein